MLICSLLLSAITIHSDEEFTPQTFTWTYSVQAKDANNMEDLRTAIHQIRSIINEAATKGSESNASNFFQKFLVFVKELQEAIAAGFNLFGAVSTSQQPLLQVAEDFVEQALDQAVETQETNEVKSLDNAEVVSEPAATPTLPRIIIAFTCSVQNPAELESWNTSKSLLEELATSLNNNTISSDEVVASIIDIYQSLTALKNAQMDVSASNLDVMPSE